MEFVARSSYRLPINFRDNNFQDNIDDKSPFRNRSDCAIITTTLILTVAVSDS